MAVPKALCSGNAKSQLEAVIEHLVGRQGQPLGAQVHANTSHTSLKGWQWRQGCLSGDPCLPEAFQGSAAFFLSFCVHSCCTWAYPHLLQPRTLPPHSYAFSLCFPLHCSVTRGSNDSSSPSPKRVTESHTESISPGKSHSEGPRLSWELLPSLAFLLRLLPATARHQAQLTSLARSL